MSNEPKIITRDEAVAYVKRRHSEGAQQREIMYELRDLGYVTRRGVPPSHGAIWGMLFPERAEALRREAEKKKRRSDAAKARWEKKQQQDESAAPVAASVTRLPPVKRGAPQTGTDPVAALLAVKAVLEHPDLDSETKVEIALQLMKKV